MFYYPKLSSSFNEDKYLKLVKSKLNNMKSDVDMLVTWNKKYIDECNMTRIEDKKYQYNQDYLELQRLINKILTNN